MSEPVWLDSELLRDFPLPALSEDGDKEDRGLALVVAGCPELPGTAILTGNAALRAGAGKLQIVTDKAVSVAVGIVATGARVIGGFEDIAARVEHAAAVIFGPGMDGEACHNALREVLGAPADVPLVLDAAALGCLAKLDAEVRGWPGGVVLLPHSREMSQLLDCAPEEVEIDPLHAVQRAAERYNAVALVKGGISIIAAPDGRLFRFRGGGVGLATSGSGDVLAGIVGGIAARGADPLTATLWGVWLHGEAGRVLSSRIGKVGFLAHEIANEVPALLGR